MKIKEYTFSHRNDFSAIMVCESCGTTALLENGYHDANFHNRVIPNINCPTCDRNHYGESSELGEARRKREGVSQIALSDVKEAIDVKAWDKKDKGGCHES